MVVDAMTPKRKRGRPRKHPLPEPMANPDPPVLPVKEGPKRRFARYMRVDGRKAGETREWVRFKGR